jgi:acetone carboxylase gamma subunit
MSEATVPETDVQTAQDVGGIGDAFVLRRHESDAGVVQLHCAGCGHHYGPAQRDPKLAAVVSERSIADLSDLNAEDMVDRLVARHYFCPSCGLLFAVNVQQHGDPVMLEWSLQADGEVAS